MCAEQRWPQWGGDENWQERLRRDLPIFHLGLQPCATQHEVAPQQSGAALAGVTHRAVAGLTHYGERVAFRRHRVQFGTELRVCTYECVHVHPCMCT